MQRYNKLKHYFQDKIIRLNETVHLQPAQTPRENTRQFCGTAPLTFPIIRAKSIRKAEFLSKLYILLWFHILLMRGFNKQVQDCERIQKDQKILRSQLLHEQPLTDGSHLWRLQNP